MEIRALHPCDEDVLANVGTDVFDHALDPGATREFLRDPRHHIVVAIDDEVVVGFASAVHYFHPDKPKPELFINEVGVASTHRRRGIGTAILRSLIDHGRSLGCVDAWVLTERSNPEAMALYAKSGGDADATDHVMFTFRVVPLEHHLENRDGSRDFVGSGHER
jgi:ribosomal protein S18 acetylase RimI-like enzyme